jgi:hypothetical protein
MGADQAGVGIDRARAVDFDGIAARSAVVAGVGAVVFTVIFAAIVIGVPIWVVGVWWVLLIGGELLCVPVLVALHRRLAGTVPGMSVVALIVGALGLMGGIAHGGQQLEYVVKPPPGALRGGAAVELDPRGLFRYLMFGLALLLFAWLLARAGSVPTRLVQLTYLSGVLLVVIYIGRLTQVITPGDRITLAPPILFGLIVNPAWYFAVVRWLRPPPATPPLPATPPAAGDVDAPPRPSPAG